MMTTIAAATTEHLPLEQQLSTMDFDDPEGFVDESLDEDEELAVLRRQVPVVQTDVSNIVILDKLPLVGEDRFEKLVGVIKKALAKGPPFLSVQMPMDDGKTTAGLMFVKYANAKLAGQARALMDGHRLDKTHRLVANIFSESMAAETEQESAPFELEIPEFEPVDGLHEWMREEHARDQFLISHGAENLTEVYLNSLPESGIVIRRDSFSTGAPIWSPFGTYLASFHEQGVGLWGAPDFRRVARFPHKNVRCVKFSPDEQFIITSSSKRLPSDSGGDLFDIHIKLFDVVTSLERFSFNMFKQTSESVALTALKFNSTSEYLCRLDSGQLFVHRTSDFEMVSPEFVAENVADYVLCPTEPSLMTFWSAEQNNKPASVSVIDFVQKKELRTKNLFNVISCHIKWQDRGDFVCVQVDRYTKIRHQKKVVDTKKSTTTATETTKFTSVYYNFEVFRVREKNCPLETLELKSNVLRFVWEPNGGKQFLVIHEEPTESLDGTKFRASFYDITAADIQLSFRLALEVDDAAWSPRNPFCVLSWTRGRMSQRIYFVDVDEKTVVHSEDFPMLNKVAFDPSGRFIAACALAQSQPSDTSYVIYSLHGRKLARKRIYNLRYFAWRPRHPSCLNEDQLREVRRDMKKFTGKFKSADEKLAINYTEEQQLARKVMRDRVQDARKRNQKLRLEQREKLVELRFGAGTKVEPEVVFVEVESSVLLSVDYEFLKVDHRGIHKKVV